MATAPIGAPASVPRAARVADQLAAWLVRLGVRQALGVSGGGISTFWHAICHSDGLRVVHTAHESGAAFAATEASLASGRPVLVFTTTGPGLTNVLTGLCAARQEGARVIVVSGTSPTARELRGLTQETHHQSPLPGLFAPGPLFHEAWRLGHIDQLAPVLQRFEIALSRPGGGVVHLGLPTDLATQQYSGRPFGATERAPARPDPATLDRIAAAIVGLRLGERGVVVIGHEARRACAEVRALVARIGWPVVSTPRGKGIVPESDPRCIGVIGFGGQAGAERALAKRHDVVLALGTSLSEAASGHQAGLDARRLLVRIGPGPDLPGAYSHASVLAVDAEVGEVAAGLVARLPAAPVTHVTHVTQTEPPPPVLRETGLVRPSALLRAIQTQVIDRSDALVMAESGNSFAWAIHALRLDSPRLRVSVDFGAMGHMSSGVIGPAIDGRRTVAIVGDGAMLMQNELATAVREQLPATWIVLNDAGYGMCAQGLLGIGLPGTPTSLAPVDFATYAAAMGARAERVRVETELADALDRAIRGPGPCVLDVHIDPHEPAPIGRRVRALAWHDEAAS